MITTITKPNKYGTGIVIYAYEGEGLVGKYSLATKGKTKSDEDVVGSRIDSFAPNLGVPKTLISEAQKQLGIMAIEKKRSIIHEVGMIDPLVARKLEKHFYSHGYARVENIGKSAMFRKKFEYKESEK
ncbi:hypothetical protein HY989_05665 [Candidatus Micrarchaeota archaeon]|nr:hypothetical protein [Candidatus Micrarchaeota archaeon]